MTDSDVTLHHPHRTDRVFVPEGATILRLTDEQVAAYPDGCPFEGADGHPKTPLLHYNAPAVMAIRTDTDGEHYYAYYICQGCWTGWWTSWGKRHQ
jgi:hypothetical protein